MTFQPMETPLVISGLDPESIRFWQQQTAGTSLETIAAGGYLRQPRQLFRAPRTLRAART